LAFFPNTRRDARQKSVIVNPAAGSARRRGKAGVARSQWTRWSARRETAALCVSSADGRRSPYFDTEESCAAGDTLAIAHGPHWFIESLSDARSRHRGQDGDVRRW